MKRQWKRKEKLLLRKTFYFISLHYRFLMNKMWGKKMSPWWNTIDSSLILGALPLQVKLEEMLKSIDAPAILSLVEDFELQGLPFCLRPVSKDDWKYRQIPHLQLSLPDMKCLSNDQFDQGIEFIEEQKAKGRQIYVHCKAGRGRSASLVAAYYAEKYKLDVESALKKIRDKRPLSAPSKKQIQSIVNYFKNKKSPGNLTEISAL